MVGITGCGRGVDVRRCWVPCNGSRFQVKLLDILSYFILIVDINMEISMFCGYYPHFVKYPRSVDIIHISCIYPYFLEIICILWKYPRSKDNIRIFLPEFSLGTRDVPLVAR